MQGIRAWLMRWFSQDDFVDDWYGWLTNQISHLSVGVMAALAVSVAWYYIEGEFPFKVVLWPLLLGVYVLGEIVRGWKSWDSIEDTIFFAGYGAGGALLVFSEITPGQPMLIVSAVDVLPILGLAAAHLAAGVAVRIPER